MTYGPIDLMALEFPGNRFRGEILPELFDLVEKGIIRIIDLVVIMKDQGEVIVRECRELDAAHIADVRPAACRCEPDDHGERHQCDCRATRRRTARGAVPIKNLWAKKTMQAMLDANGRMVMLSVSRMMSWKKRWPTSPALAVA